MNKRIFGWIVLIAFFSLIQAAPLSALQERTTQEKYEGPKKREQAAKPAKAKKPARRDKAGSEKEIRALLDAQKAAWNDKKIEAFMSFYWKSKDLTYYSANTPLRGWTPLLNRYKKRYSGEDWGALDFSDIEVRMLGGNAAYVLGRWKLLLKDKPSEGAFTLILRRRPEGWRIVHDHTS